MKTKGAGGINDLYFAEVTCFRGKYEAHVLTFLSVVNPDENGIFLSFTNLISQT